VSDFDFQTASAAGAAAQALLDQVFLGAFETDHTRTFGCSGPDGYLNACWTLVPFSPPVFGFNGAFAIAAINNNGVTDATDLIQFDRFDDLGDGIDDMGRVFARFTPSAATAAPEPSSWALMIAGLGLAGAALRRRRALPRKADPASA
jgi:hypothetical protein